MGQTKDYLYGIDYIKLLACVLIINFHSDILLPPNLSWLAFGGDIGNNLFFCISGYTLYQSLSNQSKFSTWTFRRIVKILPYTWLFTFGEIAMGLVQVQDAGNGLSLFFFPTLYWFSGAIIPFYFLLFAYSKIENKCIKIGIWLLFIPFCFVDPGISRERYLIGFFAMLTSYELRRYLEVKEISLKRTWIMILSMILTVGVYLILKLLGRNGFDLNGIIFIPIGVSTVMIAGLLLCFTMMYREKIACFSHSHFFLYSAVKKLSNCTLAAYLVNQFGERIIEKKIMYITLFPVSYVINMILTLCLAYIITTIITTIVSVMKMVKNEK